MKRSTLLRKVVEPSPSGRVHDVECDCVKWWYHPEEGWIHPPLSGCPICHGTGRVSKRLSRREAHAIVTWHRQNDKVAKRATEEMRKDALLRWNRLRKRIANGEITLPIAKVRQLGMTDATMAFMEYMCGELKEWRW